MHGTGHADDLSVLQMPRNKADAVPCERLRILRWADCIRCTKSDERIFLAKIRRVRTDCAIVLKATFSLLSNLKFTFVDTLLAKQQAHDEQQYALKAGGIDLNTSAAGCPHLTFFFIHGRRHGQLLQQWLPYYR